MSDSTVSKDAVVVERIFDAPVELIWQLWTQPELFKTWYGPEGFSIPVAEMDVRVGGKHLFCMERQTPQGSMKMWSTGEYTEVVPNERLSYTDSIADEHGNVVTPAAYGMNDDYPVTTEVTVLFEVVNGRTKMTMTHAGVTGNAGGGWEQAFAKMAARIDSILKR